MNEKLMPKLFTVMKNYSKKQFAKDVVAGIIVAIIALPLSIALAIASGVEPQYGIYTAIIAGFIVAFLGGSRVQIAGPTAAFATIVAGIIAKNGGGNEGMRALALATIMAGIILIIMGVFKFGNLIKFIPFTITTGFTAGIAVTIVIGQLKDFFGIVYKADYATPIETVDKIKAIFDNMPVKSLADISSVNCWPLFIGVVSLAILIVWPYINKVIPGSLVAVIVASLIVAISGIKVSTIGDLYTITRELPSFVAPLVTWDRIVALLPDAFTIAVLAAIESLLSCVVSDGMIGSRHRSNTELVAQGVGNIGSALFGGIPATGAIARTAANIKNGGRTPVAGMVHSVVLVLFLVLLMPLANHIPMPTIAAILIMVAYNMCGWRTIASIFKKSPKSDIFVLVVTFILTVTFDLVVAIAIGLALACILFMKKISDSTEVSEWQHYDEENDEWHIKDRTVPNGVFVYEITGPLFFGATDKLSTFSDAVNAEIAILRMRSVPSIDGSAVNKLEEIIDIFANNGTQVIFSHTNKRPYKVLQKAGLVDKIGKENFVKNIDEALALAAKKIEDRKEAERKAEEEKNREEFEG